MDDALMSARPAWQTDELEDEWIDQDEADDSVARNSSYNCTTSDLSLTQPIGSVLARNDDLETSSPVSSSGGTFLVREDVPAAPLLPQTPGRNKKGMVKDFFSPLALEKMFEPPSPPSSTPAPLPSSQSSVPPVPSRLSQVYIPGEDEAEHLEDESEGISRDQWQDSGAISQGLAVSVSPSSGAPLNCQFTFEMPRRSPFDPMTSVPEAQSTPGAPNLGSSAWNAPLTDPRLRLFQFQYDTFTREHLSAMVDSIAVNTPSGGSGQSADAASPTSLSPVREVSTSRLRSIKRIKLSPASDYSDRGDGAAVIMRPLTLRRDYVGESKSLMEKIRQARDFSTVSTVATARSPDSQGKNSPALDTPNATSKTMARPSGVSDADVSRAPSTTGTASTSNRGTYSSLAYREQAANLMAQIKRDMKGSKRIFSGDTELSHMTLSNDNEEKSAPSAPCMEITQLPMPGRNGKENVPEEKPNSRVVSSRSPRSNKSASPRKHLRRPSCIRNVEQQLADQVSNVSLDSQDLLEQFPAPPVGVTVTTVPTAPSSPADTRNVRSDPGFLAPPSEDGPAYPSSSVRSGRNEDLTRFVSSSTASGTTLTTGSAASFVKHPGPKQITRITPDDVPTLPNRVGKMVFDKVMMRWVKDTALAVTGPAEDHEIEIPAEVEANDSEDPFRDIESLGEEEPRPVVERDELDDQGSVDFQQSRIDEVETESEVEDEEEVELTSFSFDEPSSELVQAMAGEEPDPDDTDSEDEDTTAMRGPSDDESDDSDDVYGDPVLNSNGHASEHAIQDSNVLPCHIPSSVRTPTPPARASAGLTPTPVIRSAMKSNSITPMSAMKNNSGNRTPANRLAHRRSVSFSDGKRDGPILGIGRNAPSPDITVEDDSPLASGSNKSAAILVPSARTRRIADMLDNLEDLSMGDESPSKTSSAGKTPADELHPIEPRRPSSIPSNVGGAGRGISRRVVSRSQPLKSPRSSSRSANGTFLTECSFGVAHDRLVQVITDVQPFEPYWEELTSIDLSKKNVDSVARLKEFLPRLDSLSVNGNQLSWLSGVPGTVRSLSVASNSLTGITSFSHLLNLESLDVSRNHIDSLRQLECLRHLRELRADGNKIDSIDGLQKMDGLVKLSLQGNVLRAIDFKRCHWARLEMLNLSQNRLVEVAGLVSLPAMVALNLDNNSLAELEFDGTLPRLRILRVSGNRLQRLNAPPFPNLRTLYADNNMLGTITKAYRLTKLENLSLRNQSGRTGLSLSIYDVRDVKRLYLSGNPLDTNFLTEPCYNLVYLEAAACRLTALPAELARLIPNVRVLNLNYNFLADLRPLAGLARLRKLSLIGSRIAQARQLVRILHGMHDLEMIDFRMNPCTLGWYLPLLVRDVPGALQPSDERNHGRSAGIGNNEAQNPREDCQPARGVRGESPPPQGSSSPARRAHSPGADAEAEADTSVMVPPTWKDLDAKFRRDLPDAAYVGRLAYRGLVMRACARIRMLDGVEVGEKEREKAEQLLRGVLSARQGRKLVAGEGEEQRRECGGAEGVGVLGKLQKQGARETGREGRGEPARDAIADVLGTRERLRLSGLGVRAR